MSLDSEAPLSICEPMAGRPVASFDIAVRSSADPQSITASGRNELCGLEPALLVENVQTMSSASEISSRRAG
jgi:hypothetical protein